MASTRGVRLRPPSGGAFRFDLGARCLEFAVTGGEGYRAAYETLHTPADLGRWMRDAFGVAPAAVTDADLAGAKRFREAIWECADARADGRPLPKRSIEVINEVAAQPPLAPRIEGTQTRAWAEPASPGQVLSTLARDAIELLTGPLSGRIRRCASKNCSLIFADTSRPGRRRWCAMARCGNRAKVGAFRHRLQKEESP